MGFCVCSCRRRRGPGEGGGRLPGAPPFRPRPPERLRFHFPRPTTPRAPQRIETGGSIRPGAPLRAPGERDVPGAPGGGRGDRGAGSAGQVTYPGPRAEGFVRAGGGGGGGGGRGAAPRGLLSPSPPPSPARWKPIGVCSAKSERETSPA
nr:translation initiation factor IF-2-like isoform X1 [Saimiri boliviensis boliviensis]